MGLLDGIKGLLDPVQRRGARGAHRSRVSYEYPNLQTQLSAP